MNNTMNVVYSIKLIFLIKKYYATVKTKNIRQEVDKSNQKQPSSYCFLFSTT